MAKIDIERFKELRECGLEKDEALDIVKSEAEFETKIEMEKLTIEKQKNEENEKKKEEEEEKNKKEEEKNNNLTKEDIEQMIADREADKKTEKEEDHEDMGALWARLHK